MTIPVYRAVPVIATLVVAERDFCPQKSAEVQGLTDCLDVVFYMNNCGLSPDLNFPACGYFQVGPCIDLKRDPAHLIQGDLSCRL